MNLHRSSNQPDWEALAPSQYNLWQRLAATTHGFITPGNIITVVGLILVVVGLAGLWRQNYWPGLATIAIGRGFDLLDGLAAEATGTKSPLGETFDATADKLGTFLALLTLPIVGLAPWALIAALAAPHIIISVIAYRAERGGHRLHPSRLGKLSMAAAWISLLALIVPRGLGAVSGSIAYAPGYILALASAGMGLAAAQKYYLEYSKSARL